MYKDRNGYLRVWFFYIYTLLIIIRVKNSDIHTLFIGFRVYIHIGIHCSTVI